MLPKFPIANDLAMIIMKMSNREMRGITSDRYFFCPSGILGYEGKQNTS